MKTQLAVGISCVLSIALSSNVEAGTINFDDLSYDVLVTNQYAGLGVTFSNALTGPTRIPALLPFGSFPGASSPTVLRAAEAAFAGFQPQPTNPIVAVFAIAMTSVSITGLGVGPNGVMLTAYDAISGGNAVDTVQAFAPLLPDDQFQVLTVNGSNIRRVEFSQVLSLGGGNNFDDTFWDNLVFASSPTPVPLPAAAWLLGAGVLGMVGLVRRNRGAISQIC